jgi:hypothetical protein
MIMKLHHKAPAFAKYLRTILRKALLGQAKYDERSRYSQDRRFERERYDNARRRRTRREDANHRTT